MIKRSVDVSLPCPTCPWRVDQDAIVIPNYNHEKACGLMGTVGKDDAFRPIMACHGSLEGRERICIGYLAQAGWSNIAVRLLMIKNEVPAPDDVLRACKVAGIKLHRTYGAVLAKLKTTNRSNRQ